MCYSHGLPNRIPGSHFARNLIERKSLIFQLVKRDFQQRYVGSAAGWVWSLIHPLVLLASYTYIFKYCMHVRLSGAVTNDYTLFLFGGMLPWLLFSETVVRSSGSIVEQANLVTKTMFPSEIVPVSIYLSSLVSHILVAVIFAITCVVTQGYVNPGLALLPIYALVLGIFAIGIGWIAAALQVYLRDTAQVILVIMTFWLWLTPIFIQESQIPARVRGAVIWWNPLSYFVRIYRTILLGRSLPSQHDLAIPVVFAVLAFVCGGLFFRHMKRGFADVL